MHIRIFASSTRVGAALVLAALLVASSALASVESEIAFHRGVVAYGEGRLEDARAAFEIVLASDPEDSSAMHYLGLIASEQGQYDDAIGHLQQAHTLDPENLDTLMDLGIAYLEAGRLPEASSTFGRVLAADPNHARANLFAGITAYRAGDYEAAVPSLDRAVELDPELRPHARYYAGLSQAFLGDIPAATGSLSDVEQSPVEPLANSAAAIREQLEPERPRPWSVAFTAGGEFDDNPTVLGSPFKRMPDGRAVFRLRGSYRFLDTGRFNASAGYDGFLSVHGDVSIVDLQTHVGFVTGGVNLDPFRLNVRYEYAYTFADLTSPFRELNRVTPSGTWRQWSWGVAQLYYQYNNRDIKLDLPASLDRSGEVHSAGFNQFVFPGELFTSRLAPISYFRLGSLGEWSRTQGTEFDFNAWEISAGTAAQLPWQVTLTLLYRYTQRDYLNQSIFPPMDLKWEHINRLAVEFVKPVGQHLEVSLGGTFRWNSSNTPVFDYVRNVAGGYVTYRF